MQSDTSSEASPPRGAEIRTFLFADVRGYTRYTREHGDEAASLLAGRLAEIVREVVPEFHGDLFELRGDEAVSVFFSAREAIRAAVEVQRRLREQQDGEARFPLGVGMGIDSGEAVPTEGGFRGGALNLAARLCAIAKPGQILASDHAAHLAGRVDGVRLVDRRPVRLKGIERAVRLVEVVSAVALPPVPVPVPRRRRRPTLLHVAALGALASLLVGAALLAGTFGGGATTQALAANAIGALTASGGVSLQVVVPGGGRPGGIAAGAGRVWATDTVNGSLLELDPASGAIVDTVPEAGLVPAGLAVGGGGVWVADAGGARVRWFNAGAPTAGTAITVGQGPGPIAYGLGAAWVVNTIDGTLQRISRRLQPSPPIAIGGSPTAVAVGAGSVWVTESGANSVIRVSRGGQVIDRVGVGNDPVAVTVGGGDVWVANAADGTVTRIDTRSDAKRVVAVGGQPSAVTFAGDSVWVTTAQPNRVARIDPSTLAVTETQLASPPQAIAHIGERVWVTSLASAASHRGGTLRVLFGTTNSGSPFAAGFHPFDPGAAPYAVHFSLLHLTNDGLVALRHVGGAAGGQVVPDLAVALPVITDRGRTYTFRLRTGIRYSNGEPVKPSDFRFAIERQFLNPISYGRTFFTDIRGASACERSRRRCRAALAAGIVPDDKTGTLTIHLDHPDDGFVYNLTTTFADLLPPTGTPPIDSGKPVPATGPYVITQASANHVTLVRNPHFHVWSADARPAGFPDVISWALQPNAGRALTEVENGHADVMLDQPPAARSKELRTTYAPLIHPYVVLETSYIAFNTRRPPFSSVLARRAVNLAVDRRRVVALQGGTEVRTPTCQVLPPTMFGYRPYCPYTVDPNPASGIWKGPNPKRALALIRTSGTHGDAVVLRACACVGVSRSMVDYVASLLTRLGYHVNQHWFPNTSTGYQAYSNATGDPALPLVVIEGWYADYPYPTDFFEPLLMCGTGTEPGIKFCDPHLDHLVHSALTAQGAAALDEWQAADREAVDQAAWAPLSNLTGIDVIGRRLGDYQRNPQFGEILDQLWVK